MKTCKSINQAIHTINQLDHSISYLPRPTEIKRECDLCLTALPAHTHTSLSALSSTCVLHRRGMDGRGLQKVDGWAEREDP
mmetsp:Transcript_33553/g.96885  ORF Transcript_33553/g.96885 Transcript_33553/m.96885 type:complete len:81 (-) Transcript_33553:229-471(-)